ncbi:MAG: YihY/virulence factor BrkB family protein [Pseudomonadota bacterium]
MPRPDQPSVSFIVKIAQVLREATRAFNDHQQAVVAGHLAFVALLSLFPFLVIVVALAAAVGSTEAATEVLEVALAELPEDVAAALGPVARDIAGAPRTGTVTFGFLAALWVASSGFEALRYAFNLAYHVQQQRQLWWRRLHSLAVTLAFAASVLLATISVVVVPLVLKGIAALLDRPSLADVDVPLAGPIVGVALLILFTAILYKVLPRPQLRLVDTLPGAVLAVAAWYGATVAFTFYLEHVATYSITYGSLGGVAATLVFFYVVAGVVLFGCEFNAALLRART